MGEYDLTQADLLATFVDEAADIITALESGLLALEKTPGDAELRRELLRHAHTLKGNASCVGLQAMTTFAHAYEELLERIEADELLPDSALVTLLLSGIDTFRRLVADGERPLTSRSGARSVRVSADRLNRMLNLAGEIVIARGRVQQELTGDTVDVEALIEIERELDFLNAELQELIMRSRMVPVGPLFRHYERTVRDLAAGHGKTASLVINGEEVEIDTTAVEMLRDPLTHMIRNAIDHGLESPAERIAKGKPAAGTITLAARHEAGTIIISMSDDGAGLDRNAIAARAHELGLDTARMSEAEIDRLIFENGFSTSSGVTDLSGRGVGMDVVRRGIEALRGTISISSQPGAGTTFTIRLPLTLAVIEGFGVSAADETYVVPMESVVECVEFPADEPRDRKNGVLLLRDEVVPYVRLRVLFSAGGDAPARENVLVVQYEGGKAGLVVDELHGSGQAVIKPLGDYFGQVPGVAGSSILGSGRVALILDTQTILEGLGE